MPEQSDPDRLRRSKHELTKDLAVVLGSAAPSLETELPSAISLDEAGAWQRRCWRRSNTQPLRGRRGGIRNVERPRRQSLPARLPGILSLPDRRRLQPGVGRTAAFHFREFFRAG